MTSTRAKKNTENQKGAAPKLRCLSLTLVPFNRHLPLKAHLPGSVSLPPVSNNGSLTFGRTSVCGVCVQFSAAAVCDVCLKLTAVAVIYYSILELPRP